MPGGDRTGPTGAGPLTGRGLGYCTGGIPRRGAGYRFGGGCGYGYDFRRGAQSLNNIQNRQVGVSTEDEKNFLENRLSALEDQIKNIRNMFDSSESGR